MGAPVLPGPIENMAPDEVSARVRTARKAAAHVSSQVLAVGGYIPGRPARAPQVREALAESIRLRNTLDSTRRERARQRTVLIP